MHWVCRSIVAVAALGLALSPCWADELPTAERGREIMLHKALNPGIWSRKAYDNLWKVWGLRSKPANYDEAVRERYGLHAAPFDNHGLPLGLMESRGFLSTGIVNTCLLCHAGSVAGELHIGMGNASVDVQSLFEELSLADGFQLGKQHPFSNVRGTVDPVNPVTFLMQFRDPELNVQQLSPLTFSRDIYSDPPAWWLIKKKKTRDWTGGIDARSTRVDMVNLLNPLNTAEYIKKHESDFAAISAFLLTISPPKYPFPIDRTLAGHGEQVFVETCSKCHGTYGTNPTYPNRIVPLGVIGTDRSLADALQGSLLEVYNRSWFARELGPDGEPFHIMQHAGYQAPPLDGVWATAPYLHNASVPTLYHLLKSEARPKFFTRSYRTGKEEYDTAKLGWKITVLDKPASPDLPAVEQRKVYDTTQPGHGNRGHTFGDTLTEADRLAVLEYLKTL
jgi:mono/diheme cytochrome c family protein